MGIVERGVYMNPGLSGEPRERNKYTKAVAELTWILRCFSGGPLTRNRRAVRLPQGVKEFGIERVDERVVESFFGGLVEDTPREGVNLSSVA